MPRLLRNREIAFCCLVCRQPNRAHAMQVGRTVTCSTCMTDLIVPDPVPQGAPTGSGDPDAILLDPAFGSVDASTIADLSTGASRDDFGGLAAFLQRRIALLVLIGLYVVMVFWSLNSIQIAALFFQLSLIASVIALMIGVGLSVIIPFQESLAVGFCNLLVPFYNIYYTVTRWNESKYSVYAILLGVLFLSVGVLVVSRWGGGAVLDPEPLNAVEQLQRDHPQETVTVSVGPIAQQDPERTGPIRRTIVEALRIPPENLVEVWDDQDKVDDEPRWLLAARSEVPVAQIVRSLSDGLDVVAFARNRYVNVELDMPLNPDE